MKTQTTIRLPLELKEQLQKQAQKMGISFNAMYVITLQNGLKGLK